MSIHYALSLFEDMVSQLDNTDDNQTFQMMKVARKTLTTAGMEPSYRDQMVARMDFTVNAHLNSDEIERLHNVVAELVYKFYTLFAREGFNDQAIALMGGQIQLSIG